MLFRDSHKSDLAKTGIVSYVVDYYSLLWPSTSHKNSCSICLERNDKPKTSLCLNNTHALHSSCLIDLIERKIHDMKVNFKKRSGLHTAKINHDQLPSCPLCREVPFHHYLEVRGADFYQGTFFKIPITILGRDPKPFLSPELLEKIHAAYSLFQLGLSCLQHYPELYPTVGANIARLKLILCLVDLTAIGWSFGKVTNKPVGNSRWRDLFWGFFNTTVSLGCVLCLNQYLKPSIDLNLSISPKYQDWKVEASWFSPTIFSQVFSLQQTVISLASAYFLSNRKVHLITALFQAAHLFNLSSSNG